MNSKKLVPIIVAILIVVIGIVIYIKTRPDNRRYTELVVTYNNQDTSYKSINIDDTIQIGDYTFHVRSIFPKQIVLFSEDYLVSSGSSTDEFVLDLDKEISVCFKDNKDCATMLLK